jgi:hypothetical protein
MRRVTRLRAARPFVVVLLIAAVSALAVAAVGSETHAGAAKSLDSTGAARSGPERAIGYRITKLQPGTLQQAAIAWRGGAIVASTGETVNVLVSDAFAPDAVTPESWAEFLAKLVHGPELSSLTTYIAPLDEIRQLCGSGALGCYRQNRAVALGETLPDGTTPEEVVRHEYGHHIALYRSNHPWRAIDWGPKNWASAADICGRVARNEAYPGDERDNYAQNPGEAWAEVYRLMDERKAGITTATWPIIAPSLYPSEAALVAAEKDVVQPWTAGTQRVFRKPVARGKVWWIPLSTPLDGALAVTARLPRGGEHRVELMAANRTTMLKRGAAAGAGVRRIRTTVCGQRSLFVRVTQRGKPGLVTVVASTP